jgi:hypothetical protein
MHWEVQLTGDNADLQMLAEAFTSPDCRIEIRTEESVISSTDFDPLVSAGEVREMAKEIARALSGSSRLVLGSRRQLEVGAVYQVRDDGKRNITVFPEPGVLHLRGMPVTLSVTRSDGQVEVNRPADPITEWLPLIQRDPLVAKALRLRDEHSLNWVELYRIYEVIESDVGSSQMIKLGWITKARLKQFTHTANSVAAAGDASRHGRERTAPPPTPLPLREGRALIDVLLLAWLTWKVSQRSGHP